MRKVVGSTGVSGGGGFSAKSKKKKKTNLQRVVLKGL